jgi:hypothetical protein
MFAKIDNQIKLDEKQDESSHKYTHSVFGRVTCRDGVDCVRPGCNFGHPNGYVAPTGKGGGKGKANGKGKGKGGGGKGSRSTWQCQKPGCSDPQKLSGYRKLCTTCFTDLGAKGENSSIKLKGGTTFTLNKTEYKRANSAAVKKDKATKRKSTESPFNPDQLEFLSGTMDATAHMASDGDVGDEYIPGSAGPKSTKKAKAIDQFIAGWAQ